MTADEFDDYESGQDEPWYDNEDDGPGFDEKTAIELCDRYPGRFVSLCKVWTPERNTIDSVASHEPLVGELLAVLVSVSEPHTEEQREAMQRLRDVLYGEREPEPATSNVEWMCSLANPPRACEPLGEPLNVAAIMAPDAAAAAEGFAALYWDAEVGEPVCDGEDLDVVVSREGARRRFAVFASLALTCRAIEREPAQEGQSHE